MGFYYETGKELCCKVAKPVPDVFFTRRALPFACCISNKLIFLLDINNKLGSLFISSIDVIEVMQPCNNINSGN